MTVMSVRTYLFQMWLQPAIGKSWWCEPSGYWKVMVVRRCCCFHCHFCRLHFSPALWPCCEWWSDAVGWLLSFRNHPASRTGKPTAVDVPPCTAPSAQHADAAFPRRHQANRTSLYHRRMGPSTSTTSVGHWNINYAGTFATTNLF